MVKILMSRHTVQACDELNNKRKDRYNFRARHAEGMNLNFRMHGDPVPLHGIRRYWDRYRYTRYELHQGTCLSCGRSVSFCDCKVQVKDASGNLVEEF